MATTNQAPINPPTSPALPVVGSAEDVRSAETVDLGWLASALGLPGQLESYTAKSIGTGQVGENVRYTLQWKAGANTELATVIGKFPALDEQSRGTAAATSAYVKEVGFYRDVAALTPMATPDVYFLAEDVEANAFTLLMRDINWAEPGNQLEGCDLERAGLAVTELAKLHGPHWGSEALSTFEWVGTRDSESSNFVAGLLAMLIDGFCERYAERLSSEVLDTARWIVEVAPRWFELPTLPLTLTHGDYRPDNLLFATALADATASADTAATNPLPLVTVVDWQTASTGNGPSDLAYFLGGALSEADRHANEAALLVSYRETLSSFGVSVPEDALWHDYRVGSAAGLIMSIIASQVVAQTERGDEMFCVMAESHSAHVRDVDLRGLFDA